MKADFLTLKANKKMKMKSRKVQIAVIIGLLVLGALARVFPHAPNFTPIVAMALFGAVIFKNKNLAILLPMAALLLSDIMLELSFQLGYRSFSGFHSGMIYVYGAFFLIAFLAYFGLKKANFLSIGLGALGASVLFFLITNFGVWLSGSMYTMDFTGLIGCYTAAIPFFHNTVLSTFMYSGVFFGAYYLLNQRSLQVALQR